MSPAGCHPGHRNRRYAWPARQGARRPSRLSGAGGTGQAARSTRGTEHVRNGARAERSTCGTEQARELTQNGPCRSRQGSCTNRALRHSRPGLGCPWLRGKLRRAVFAAPGGLRYLTQAFGTFALGSLLIPRNHVEQLADRQNHEEIHYCGDDEERDHRVEEVAIGELALVDSEVKLGEVRLPPIAAISGVIRSLTSAVIRALNARPMTTATASSTRFPRSRNFLKPFILYIPQTGGMNEVPAAFMLTVPVQAVHSTDSGHGGLRGVEVEGRRQDVITVYRAPMAPAQHASRAHSAADTASWPTA